MHLSTQKLTASACVCVSDSQKQNHVLKGNKRFYNLPQKQKPRAQAKYLKSSTARKANTKRKKKEHSSQRKHTFLLKRKFQQINTQTTGCGNSHRGEETPRVSFAV